MWGRQPPHSGDLVTREHHSWLNSVTIVVIARRHYSTHMQSHAVQSSHSDQGWVMCTLRNIQDVLLGIQVETTKHCRPMYKMAFVTTLSQMKRKKTWTEIALRHDYFWLSTIYLCHFHTSPHINNGSHCWAILVSSTHMVTAVFLVNTRVLGEGTCSLKP